MNTRTYRTIIEPDDGGYHAYVPALSGCHSYGKTVEEAQKNIKSAIEGWIEAQVDNGWSVPEDTLIETLQTVQFSIPSINPSYA